VSRLFSAASSVVGITTPSSIEYLPGDSPRRNSFDLRSRFASEQPLFWLG